MVTKLVIIVRDLETTFDDLKHADDFLEYSHIEVGVSDRFNAFFFSAAATCTGKHTIWLWT